MFLNFKINILVENLNVNPNNFYAFGATVADTQLSDQNGLLELNGWKFFNTNYTNMFVNSNGILTFEQSFNMNNSLEFSLSVPIIAPFWSHINTTAGGQIFYRQSNSAIDLQKSKTDVALFDIRFSSFNPINCYIITWYQIAANGADIATNNTFQAVITTDSEKTFLIFNYDKLMWPNQKFSTDVFVGYSGGENRNSFQYEDSFTNRVTSISLKSNVNAKYPGKWVFRVDE